MRRFWKHYYYRQGFTKNEAVVGAVGLMLCLISLPIGEGGYPRQAVIFSLVGFLCILSTVALGVLDAVHRMRR